MSIDCPAWSFTAGHNRTWTWRTIRGDTSPVSFTSLDEAIQDAIARGFNPADDHWTAQTDGRITHYRAGQPAVNNPGAERS